MAGPYCAMLLADMGARVIKVEPPAGDSTRSMAGARGNDSAAFNAVNRGKHGIVLDLNHEKGRAVFTRLARDVDILVENYRPGVMAKLGLDYETLRAENPRLIYASISGHGQTGPWAAKGGFDLIAQGLSGLMSVTGTPTSGPVKVGVPITDLGAGALRADRHSRRAAPSLDDRRRASTSTRRSSMPASRCRCGKSPIYFTTGQVPAPLGIGASADRAVSGVPCADGYITIGAANDRNFAKVARVLGHHEWLTDARFAGNHQRIAHREELARLIEEETVEAAGRVLARRARTGRRSVRADPQLRGRARRHRRRSRAR